MARRKPSKTSTGSNAPEIAPSTKKRIATTRICTTRRNANNTPSTSNGKQQTLTQLEFVPRRTTAQAVDVDEDLNERTLSTVRRKANRRTLAKPKTTLTQMDYVVRFAPHDIDLDMDYIDEDTRWRGKKRKPEPPRADDDDYASEHTEVEAPRRAKRRRTTVAATNPPLPSPKRVRSRRKTTTTATNGPSVSPKRTRRITTKATRRSTVPSEAKSKSKQPIAETGVEIRHQQEDRTCIANGPDKSTTGSTSTTSSGASRYPTTPQKRRRVEIPSSQSPESPPASMRSRTSSRTILRSPLNERSGNTPLSRPRMTLTGKPSKDPISETTRSMPSRRRLRTAARASESRKSFTMTEASKPSRDVDQHDEPSQASTSDGDEEQFPSLEVLLGTARTSKDNPTQGSADNEDFSAGEENNQDPEEKGFIIGADTQGAFHHLSSSHAVSAGTAVAIQTMDDYDLYDDNDEPLTTTASLHISTPSVQRSRSDSGEAAAAQLESDMQLNIALSAALDRDAPPSSSHSKESSELRPSQISTQEPTQSIRPALTSSPVMARNDPPSSSANDLPEFRPLQISTREPPQSIRPAGPSSPVVQTTSRHEESPPLKAGPLRHLYTEEAIEPPEEQDTYAGVVTASQLLTESLMESLPGPPPWSQASFDDREEEEVLQ